MGGSWDNSGRVMEPGAPLEYVLSYFFRSYGDTHILRISCRYKRKSEDLCYPKEDVQFHIDKNSDCDAEYSEEEEQEEEAFVSGLSPQIR